MKTGPHPADPTRRLAANRSVAAGAELASANGKSSLLQSWVDGEPAAKSKEFAHAPTDVVPRWTLEWPIIDGRAHADAHVFMPVDFATGRRSADAKPVRDDACADEIGKDAGNLVLLSKPQGKVL